MGFNLGGALGGVMGGASAGSAFGPWGAAIGGIAGGLMGGFGGDGKKSGGPTPYTTLSPEGQRRLAGLYGQSDKYYKSPFYTRGQQIYSERLSPEFLSPESNPYLQDALGAVRRNAMDDLKAQQSDIADRYNIRGLYYSGARLGAQDKAATATDRKLSDIYAQAYLDQYERRLAGQTDAIQQGVEFDRMPLKEQMEILRLELASRGVHTPEPTGDDKLDFAALGKLASMVDWKKLGGASDKDGFTTGASSPIGGTDAGMGSFGGQTWVTERPY